MRRESGPEQSAEQHIKSIRRATRKKYSTEEKIRIVLSGFRGEHSIAELCRREGFAESLYYAWSKEFLEVGKRRLAGDTMRQATSGEVKCRVTGQQCPRSRHIPETVFSAASRIVRQRPTTIMYC